MATLVLQVAGAALGGIFGPVGAIVGRAVGAAAGYAIDRSIFAGSNTVEGPRLGDTEAQTSREGSPIPRVYGRARITGEVIWATRFEEVVSESREGGKGSGGGTTVRSYSYFGNFAIGLCEGPIARIGRVWADGKPFDLSRANWRLYRGDEAQEADSLIEAKQGSGLAPAYRGTAYIVFERLPLEDFGNRIPQMAFEVVRPVPGIEEKIRAVTIIPGATEFGYDPGRVLEDRGPGRRVPLNRHVDGAATDWEAALDDLQLTCPNVESVALAITWYGDDLRCGECELRPGIVSRTIETRPYNWRAAGLTRATARLVSEHDGKPAFGGTPADASVIRAIRDLKARGLKVMFTPLPMMDIPAGNALPDPYGGSAQGAYPWRGDITAAIAPGEEGSPDRTEAVEHEIAAFVGTAAPGDFDIDGDAVEYDGSGEWSFRRFVLHYAHLCKAAGGVDAFLIGSELRGLTTLRAGGNRYPFVEALVELAEDVRTVLGAGTEISYAADWSEYFGHQPADGSGDVFFHLDPLWASPAIDFVGIDNYMPLSDWREGGSHLDAADWQSGRDPAYLRASIRGGEGFDWYYADEAARQAQMRTPITDGAYGKPWVFRNKDMAGWWSNLHYDRPGGIEAATPTAWVPQSKPIRFTELGCPAVDKGANQPNVFPDAKSASGGLPHFSTGRRDDLAQRRFIEASLGFWDSDNPDFDAEANPLSPLYGGRMVDPAAIHLWTWDARPYPAFPYRLDVWSDGENWETGHWLNGRLGVPTASALLKAILADYGIDNAVADDLDGMIDGYVIGQVMAPRRALEPLASLLHFDAIESGEILRFVPRGRKPGFTIGMEALAEEEDRPLISVRRAQETELPAEVAIGFSDLLSDFRAASVNSRRLVTGSRRTDAVETGAVMSQAVATGIADTMLQDIWAGRETISFALTGRALDVEVSDICEIAVPGETRIALVTRIEDGAVRRIEARSIQPDILAPVAASGPVRPPETAPALSAPEVLLLDLPLIAGSEPGFAPRIAAFSAPWPGWVSVLIGSASAGFAARQTIDRCAVMGELTAPLPPGPVGRWDKGNRIELALYGGALSGEPEAGVLNGANIAAIGSAEAGYEVIQFRDAVMTGPGRWRLEGLLRGQAGTADRAAAGHAEGARFVLLDGAVRPLSLSEAEAGLALTIRAGPAGPFDPMLFTDVPLMAARRGLMCLAPVHPRGRRDIATGDLHLGWTRQTRTGGDSWDMVEVPLGETLEAYQVEILDGGAVRRTLTVSAPEAVYEAGEQMTDFGSLPSAIVLRIRQLSATEGPGLALEETLHV